jgi:hypothetical protein
MNCEHPTRTDKSEQDQLCTGLFTTKRLAASLARGRNAAQVDISTVGRTVVHKSIDPFTTGGEQVSALFCQEVQPGTRIFNRSNVAPGREGTPLEVFELVAGKNPRAPAEGCIAQPDLHLSA